jgi:pimeloyl-ACP methyl ester carboxylesterase
MAQDVVIVHGWSDESESFEPLKSYLTTHGFNAVEILLADYISKDDDVRIEDIGKRMEGAIREKLASGDLTAPFDLIVHSTGGLVAREWLATYYVNRSAPCKRIVMLAPANFGSKLAHQGKSLLGRIVKGFDNWFQTGAQVLNGLELASPYQWELGFRDLLGPAGQDPLPSPYGKDKVWPFVLVGTCPYQKGLRQIVNEDGSDGTVRACAANLNLVGVVIDFSTNDKKPRVDEFVPRGELSTFEFPFAVLPARDHATITDPANALEKNDPETRALGDLILDALKCDTFERYQEIASDWNDLSESTAALTTNTVRRVKAFDGEDVNSEYFHQYMQVVVQVVDDHGALVNDYFLEFFSTDDNEKTEDMELFHSVVLENVHTNRENACFRALYIDRTDLFQEYYRKFGAKTLRLSISAAPPGENIGFFRDVNIGARGFVPIHASSVKSREALGAERLRRNATHFMKLVIPRNPARGVFRLS